MQDGLSCNSRYHQRKVAVSKDWAYDCSSLGPVAQTNHTYWSIAMKNFPQQFKELTTWMEKLGAEIPQAMQGFSALHESSMQSNALDTKTKELIALGIAITVRCDGCIAFHVHDAMKAGASQAEIAETVSVAILMGGGPSVVYGIEAMQALSQYQEQGL